METKLDPNTLHQIPDSKRVREEKTPLAMAAPKGGFQPLLIPQSERARRQAKPETSGSPFKGEHERGGDESDELHILKLQVSAYLLETSLAGARLAGSGR